MVEKTKIEEMKPVSLLNREGWLTELGKLVEPLFRGFGLKPYRVTCGWPSSKGLGKRFRVIGECHGAKTSKAGFFELFISPVLDDVVDVGGTLCHEIAHVAAGIEAKHGKAFVEVCRFVGLTKGKPTMAGAGDALAEKLRNLAAPLGPYPHSAIVPTAKILTRPPSSVSLECPECGCKVTMGRKWWESAGAPTCACGGLFALPAPEGGRSSHVLDRGRLRRRALS